MSDQRGLRNRNVWHTGRTSRGAERLETLLADSLFGGADLHACGGVDSGIIMGRVPTIQGLFSKPHSSTGTAGARESWGNLFIAFVWHRSIRSVIGWIRPFLLLPSGLLSSHYPFPQGITCPSVSPANQQWSGTGRWTQLP